jgi:HEAT repeat protein
MHRSETCSVIFRPVEHQRKKDMKIISIVIIATLLAFATLATAANEKEYRPGGDRFQKVWDKFYFEPGHEPELDDPLIKAGKKMTEAICEAIKHSDMKRRRYAIGALGFIGDKRAIHTLESILKDEKEKDYFRGDALHAIYQIDEKLASVYAKYYVKRNDYLKMISTAVLKREKWLKEPTEE